MGKSSLRLIVTYKCNRSCVGCCNKQSKFSPNLIKPLSRVDYEEIMITGGEPMLFPEKVKELCLSLRSMTDAMIILYTAFPNHIFKLGTPTWLDGITITLHEQSDLLSFYRLNNWMMENYADVRWMSLRLNVFDNVKIGNYSPPLWDIKKDIKWIDNCPLPPNEDLRRLKNLWN